ncbi:terminase, partial [Clostridium perfringens]
MSDEYKLSEKYLAFLKYRAPVEALEGTTAAGKTTVGILKFMLMVAESPKKMHVIAA